MDITKDIINDIRTEIGQVIENGSTIFQAVYDYPKATLAGYPAVIVMPSENLSDYGSTATDRFTFSFVLIVYYPTRDESDYEKTELAVGEAVGDLLRLFCVRRPLTTCDWVEPVPSVWGDTVVGEVPFRTATITLRCIKYVGVN